MLLTGKNAVIVGGFGGIGLPTCRQLLQKKIANLVIVDFIENRAIVADLQKEYPSTPISLFKMDITKKAEIESVYKQIIEKIKFVDILLNFAGVIADNNPEFTMDVNLLGLINSTLTMLKYMDKTQGGRGGLIVNVASILGLIPYPALAVYSASKHGVIGFTRSLGVDFYFERTGVALITICPGFTETSLIEDLKCIFPYSSEYHKAKNPPVQSADVCAQNIVQAIQMNKNGSVWICDQGKLEEQNMKKYWDC